MTATTLVILKHPDSPNPIEVEPDRVPVYAASGWVVVKPAPAPKAKK